MQQHSDLFATINLDKITKPILTVGDSNRLIELDGIVQLATLGKNIIFYINQLHAEKLDLSIHYKVLTMAKDFDNRPKHD